MLQDSKQALLEHPSVFTIAQKYFIKQPQEGFFLSPDQGLIARAAPESSLTRSIFHHCQ
jgi:hypothetical protein